MGKKYKFIYAAIIIILLLALGFVVFKKEVQAPTRQNNPAPSYAPKEASSSPNIKAQDEILKNALNLYLEKKRENVDMSNGPCLGKIADDWVLDIAHNPRQLVDNKPENQCSEIKNATAHHFVELDPDGKLIRIY